MIIAAEAAVSLREVPAHLDWGRHGAGLEDRYEKLGVIGSGVFGTVYKARDRETDAIVAMKHLHLEGSDLCDGVPAQVIREVSLLRDFVHPNIAELRNIQINGLGDYDLILEYIDVELHTLLRQHRKDKDFMPMDQVTRYTQDLLNGIHACHVRLIIHRDLKPQNILIGKDGLKICDFGLARVYSLPIKLYTHDVVTLWYRAPEILLGVPKYGPEVDIWSAGCIVAEMATCYPTFPGDSEIGDMAWILQVGVLEGILSQVAAYKPRAHQGDAAGARRGRDRPAYSPSGHEPAVATQLSESQESPLPALSSTGFGWLGLSSECFSNRLQLRSLLCGASSRGRETASPQGCGALLARIRATQGGGRWTAQDVRGSVGPPLSASP